MSVGFSALVYRMFGSIWCAVISYLAGVLIDLDHLIDFFLHFRMDQMREFFHLMHNTVQSKLIVVLHSIELIAALWIVTAFSGFNIYLVSFAIGLTQHLALDIIFNPMVPGGYFLAYRVLCGFDKHKLLRKEYFMKGET